MARVLILPGPCDYVAIHALQERLVALRAADEIGDVILMLEHAPVITIGRKRDSERHVLAAGDVPVVHIERGGDVTWHGPGQLVAYPILKLEGKRADLHLHMRSLEDAVIATLATLGLQAQRDERNTGVWLPDGSGPPRKVCSIGIACRRWVSWHGLALNVSSDLAAFRRIQPCGMSAEVMTRVIDHASSTSLQALYAPLAIHLGQALDVPVEQIWRPKDSSERAVLRHLDHGRRP